MVTKKPIKKEVPKKKVPLRKPIASKNVNKDVYDIGIHMEHIVSTQNDILYVNHIITEKDKLIFKDHKYLFEPVRLLKEDEIDGWDFVCQCKTDLRQGINEAKIFRARNNLNKKNATEYGVVIVTKNNIKIYKRGK